MTVLFAAAMFVNALLLFLVQPMFAKLLLPRFGGSPAVWTTCMLFFQSALLAGYAYSHSVVKLRRPWAQAITHLAVMALPILTLPIALSTTATAANDHPIASVLQLSAISVGASFFAMVSDSAFSIPAASSAVIARRVPYCCCRSSVVSVALVQLP